jgi:hypothetical protein
VNEHRQSIGEELEQIRQMHGGLLKPEDVVQFARNKRTALHSEFEWDDAKASAEYRLEQARRVIRVSVTVLPSPYSDQTPVRAYVSVASDRVQPGGGYRAFADVMSDDDKRAELVNEAIGEAKRWRRKYERLRELVPIFRAIDKVEAKQEAVPA